MVVKDGRTAFMLPMAGTPLPGLILTEPLVSRPVYDGGAVKFYLDGELAAGRLPAGDDYSANDTAHNMVIGADSGSNHRPGQHASVKVDVPDYSVRSWMPSRLLHWIKPPLPDCDKTSRTCAKHSGRWQAARHRI